MRIMLVDAHPEYLSILSDYLSLRLPGVSLTIVRSAEEALTLYDSSGADLVVTAQHLRAMPGLALIGALRARAPHLPIVMHTADDALRLDAMLAGAHAFVTKGDRGALANLVAAIRRLLPAAADLRDGAGSRSTASAGGEGLRGHERGE